MQYQRWIEIMLTREGSEPMDDIKANWLTIKETIKREYDLTDISYKTWVEPLEFYKVINDVVNIIIPSEQSHMLDYISSRYKSFFKVAITEMFNHYYEVSFILKKDIPAEAPSESVSENNPDNDVNGDT